MNVAFDPWIPVVDLEGKPRLASLYDVLTSGHLLADLAVRPHERVSLMRLFLCVAHAALDGPKDYDDWQKVPKRLPEAAGGYLYTWKDSFELFHPTKPWLQIADLESGKIDGDGWGAVSKLRFFMASGANTTLYDHEGMDNNERSMGLSETILSMISFQCFSPGGLISQVFWQGMQTSKSSKDGPCVPASMVHVLLRRENMLQTLHSNLPTYEEVRLSYAPHPIGRPPWEKMPTSLADADAVGNSTASYLGRLVPLTRLIRLHENGSRMLMGEGLACPAFTDGFPAEPTAIVVVRIKDKVPVRALLSYRPGRALWRELGAIAVKRSAKSAGETGGPLSLKSLGQGESCDLVVCALARDQATILDTTESVFHIPSRMRSDEGLSLYQSEVLEAEEMSKRLGWAIEDYRKTVDGGWEGRLKSAGASKGDLLARLHGQGNSHYWTMVEQNLGLLMAQIAALGTDQIGPIGEAWKATLLNSAREAYSAVCGQETPRQLKAFMEGWRKLNSRPKEQESQSKKKEAKV